MSMSESKERADQGITDSAASKRLASPTVNALVTLVVSVCCVVAGRCVGQNFKVAMQRPSLEKQSNSLKLSLQIVSFKKAGFSLGPYPYFILIFVSGVFVPIFFLTVVWIRFTSGGFVGAQTSLGFLRHFLVVGVCSGLNGICIVFSNPHVSGITQSLLGNSTLIFTVILAVLFLRQSLATLQWLGVTLVLVGALCETVLPTLGQKNSTESFSLFWTFLFALAQLPQAFSSIYQEKVFADNPEGVNVFLFL